MSLAYTYNGSALTHSVAPSGINIPQRADHGEAEFGGIPIEDPTGSLTIVGHRPFIVEESACSQPRLFTGWTTSREYGREMTRGLFVGPVRRLVDTTIVSLDALWNFRMITGTDGNRPAETWSARLTWLLGSSYLSGLIEDTGYVITITQAMDAADYRGSYPKNVCDDLVDRIAVELNYHAFWDPVALKVGLFFDHMVDAVSESTLSISNVWADRSATCIAVSTGTIAKLSREPDQTYSGVTVNYKNGSVYRHRQSTADAYIERNTSINRPYTSLKSTAITQAEWFLDQHAGELDRITATIRVPAASAGLVWAGQRMNVKFSHLPGYSTFTSMRVVACTPTPTNDLANYYDIALELVSPRASTSGGPCSPIGRTLELVQSTTTWDDSGDAYTTVVLDAAPTCGNIVVAVLSCRGAGFADATIPGFTKYGPFNLVSAPTISIFIRTAEAGDSATITATGTDNDRRTMWAGEIGGSIGLDVYATTIDQTGATLSASVTPEAGEDALLLAVSAFGTIGDQAPYTSVPLSSATEVFDNPCDGGWAPYTGINWRTIAAASGAYSGGVTRDDGGAGGNYPVPTGSTVLLAFSAAPADTNVDLGPARGVPTQATTDPTVNDDTSAGFEVGDHWINTTSGHEFVAVDVTDGAAVWISTTAVSVFSFSTTDGTTTVDPTTSLTFVNATLADLGSGAAELTLSGAAGRSFAYFSGG